MDRIYSFALDVQNGTLTPISSLATGMAGSVDLVLHPDGTRLYLSNDNSGSIQEYGILPSGVLNFARQTTVFPSAQGYFPICIDAGGKYLFISRTAASGFIQMVRIDSDGTLINVGQFNVGDNAQQCVTTTDTLN